MATTTRPAKKSVQCKCGNFGYSGECDNCLLARHGLINRRFDSMDHLYMRGLFDEDAVVKALRKAEGLEA